MNTITGLVAVLAIVLVVQIFVVGYPDEPLTPAQRHYIEVLDDALYDAGYVAGMSSGQSSWTESQTDTSRHSRLVDLLQGMPRPNMTDSDAAATSALRYQEGWDDGATSPFNAADVNTRRERLVHVCCGELISARRAAFQNSSDRDTFNPRLPADTAALGQAKASP